MWHRSLRRWTQALAAAALLSGTGLAAQAPGPAPAWDVTVGAMALVVPRYPGSDQYRVTPFPMAQVAFRRRIYLGPSSAGLGAGLGAFLVRTDRLELSAELGLGDNRPSSRADALAGMDDREVAITAGAGLTHRAGPVAVSLAASRGVNDGGGTLATARLSLSRPFGRLIPGVGVGLTVADGRQLRREFGVTEIEAGRRQTLIDAGDPRLRPGDGRAYRPDGGLRSVGASLSLVYLLSRRWTVLGFGGVDRLSDEAAASPLVRRRGQYAAGMGLGYRL